jgi:excisionase family DNA binding protein
MERQVNREALYDLLTVKDVAGILKISLPLAYQLFKRKDFPALRIGQRQQIKVSRAAFDDWIIKGTKKVD